MAENFPERLALWSGQMPAGVFESWMGLMLTRTVMAASKLNIFDSLADGPRTPAEVAERCATHPGATGKLLTALVGIGCLKRKGGRYRLRRSTRAWLLSDHLNSCHHLNLMHYLEWRWWEHCEEYVRSGQPLHVHQSMTDADWQLYQRGMRASVAMYAPWLAKQLPLPPGAEQMLDIGGSHGYYSVAICRRHPRLRSTILELPEAIAHAAPLLAAEGMGDRVTHRPGNAVTDDLGEGVYDAVLLAAIVHHFDAETNRQLMQRIARALKPGGVVAVWEPVPQDANGKVRQVGSLFDLYFGFTSQSGIWPVSTITDWIRAAGLTPKKPRSPPLLPDLMLHVGKRAG